MSMISAPVGGSPVSRSLHDERGTGARSQRGGGLVGDLAGRVDEARGSTTAAPHPSTIEALAELGLADRFLALPHRRVPLRSDVPRCERSVTVRRTLTAVLGIRPEHVRFPAQPIP
jgi:hypothetical protein